MTGLNPYPGRANTLQPIEPMKTKVTNVVGVPYELDPRCATTLSDSELANLADQLFVAPTDLAANSCYWALSDDDQLRLARLVFPKFGVSYEDMLAEAQQMRDAADKRGGDSQPRGVTETSSPPRTSHPNQGYGTLTYAGSAGLVSEWVERYYYYPTNSVVPYSAVNDWDYCDNDTSDLDGYSSRAFTQVSIAALHN